MGVVNPAAIDPRRLRALSMHDDQVDWLPQSALTRAPLLDTLLTGPALVC